jgi:hypothetical protein
VSLGTAVEDDREERATKIESAIMKKGIRLWEKDFMCVVVTVRLL